MKYNQHSFQLIILVFFIAIFLAILPLKQYSKNTEQVLPDLNQITNDAQVMDSVEPTNTEKNETQKIFANLEDIAKANSPLFPVQHQLKDGREWITSDLENYLVLYYADPLLSDVDIKGIQTILKSLKMYNGTIDGIYGPMTQEAVKQFQQHYGFEPTGIMDLDDYDLLASVYEETVPAIKKAKPTGKVSVLIILDERTIYVLENNQVFYKFPVAIGTPDTPSPIGNWKIISKDNWGDGFGTRWLGLNVSYGKYGIHGTNKPWSIGGAESHGCLRMFNRDVELLYAWVTWGTQVHIVGGNFPYNLPWRIINDGDRGSDVWCVQNRLRELGFYKWRPDGVFGWGTGHAVKEFQKANNLPVTGEVDWSTRQKMGLSYFQ